MDFSPKSLSIRKLLLDSDSFYRIPVYQRPYKWGSDEVEKLWTDIHDAYENRQTDKTQDYFLGAMVTAKPADRSEYRDVVDGQQRLTTLMILCCVIRDLYPDINKDPEDNNSVTERDIEHALFQYGDTDKARLKLRTHDNAMSDFQRVIQKGGTTGLTKPSKENLRGDSSKYKFHNAAILLQAFLRKIGEEKVAKILNFMFDNVKVMRIDCEDVSSAIKIFQIINTRGLNLTPADLVKSYLLSILNEEYSDGEEFRGQQERVFLSDWESAEKHVASTDLQNIDDLVGLYGYYQSASPPKKGLYDDLQELFKERRNCSKNVALEAAAELKRFAEHYKERVYEKHDRIVYSLWYLRWDMLWKSVLLTALAENYRGIGGLARVLRQFYYLHWIAGKTLSSVKSTTFEVIKAVKARKSPAEIEGILKAKIADTENDIIQQVGRNLRDNSIAKESWCKPLLMMMEYDATDDAKLAFVELDRKVHLEHVLPVEYRVHEEWSHIGDSIADKYLHSGGNLTLLSGRKNIAASNSPFSNKIAAYKGGGLHGSDAGVTAFEITQDIVHNFDRGTYGNQWNEDAMRDRKKWFLEQAARILEIDIDPEDSD